ncbi:hypothetical protein ACWC0C_42370 [Streptomyces sp. NPDC001709]
MRAGSAVAYVDHLVLEVDSRNADDRLLRESAARRFGMWYSPAGNGIGHAVHQQRFGRPGHPWRRRGGGVGGLPPGLLRDECVTRVLEAATALAAACREGDGLDLLVNISQMTVCQMNLTSDAESRQQRLHWLTEHVLDWSGVPVVHVRPTVLMDNPLFAPGRGLLDPARRDGPPSVRLRPDLAGRRSRRGGGRSTSCSTRLRRPAPSTN